MITKDEFKEIDSADSCRDAVRKAGSVKALNELRVPVVEFAKPENGLLKFWQDKYWALKRCPDCGKLK